MVVKAVIPIRKGSQRVKNKNLKAFGNTTLLEFKINNLLKVRNLDEIIVNTDSEEAIEIAKICGVSYHRREDYYASSECSGSDFFEHLGKVTNTDVFAYCPCTNPFIEVTTIEESIDLFLSNVGEYDSLATVSDVKHFLWLNGSPINYERSKQPNSQNLPDIVSLNFGLSLIKKEDLIKFRNIIGLNPLFKKTSAVESIDIDTNLDYFIAEQLYKSIVIDGVNII